MIHVSVDCVTKGATTYDATFAYNNDNATAQTVPVGNDNYLTPPSFNGTQTTSFQPGTVHNAFTVKGIPNGTKLTWRVNSGGHSEPRPTYDATFAYANDNAAAQTVPGRERQLLLAAADRPRPDHDVPARDCTTPRSR